MRSALHASRTGLLLALLAVATASCTLAAQAPPAGLPLVFKADFEDGSLERWRPTDPNAWRIEDIDGGKALSLFKASKYKPPVRSPLNITLIEDLSVSDFVLDVRMLSTTKAYGHRDLCVFFGYQDPAHFYYVHIANKSDAHANSIFLVDGKPRVSIAEKRTAGTRWDDKWHDIRVVRDTKKGTIEVFYDDKTAPIMTATDEHFKSGPVGLGSFDDTGKFDDVRLWAIKADK